MAMVKFLKGSDAFKKGKDEEEVIGRVEEREERVEGGDGCEHGCQERVEDSEALRGCGMLEGIMNANRTQAQAETPQSTDQNHESLLLDPEGHETESLDRR